MISVIIPLRRGESFRRTFTGEDELILEAGGSHVAEARNLGASKSKGDFLLFLDADMDLHGLNVREAFGLLIENGFDLATAYYETPVAADKLNVWAQNLQAFLRLPQAFIGGFIACRREVWETLRFRKTLYEDIDFGLRAWEKGFKLGTLPLSVTHTRPFAHRDLWRTLRGILNGMAEKALS